MSPRQLSEGVPTQEVRCPSMRGVHSRHFREGFYYTVNHLKVFRGLIVFHVSRKSPFCAPSSFLVTKRIPLLLER